MLLRLLAIVGKELVEVIRRPGALVSLVLGPFLIMAVFGLGYNGSGDRSRRSSSCPPASGLPTDVETYQDLAGGGLHIVAVDRRRGDGRGRSWPTASVDVVVVAPADAEATLPGRASNRSSRS